MSEAGSRYNLSHRGRVFATAVEPGQTASAVGGTSFSDTSATYLLYKAPLTEGETAKEIVGLHLRMEQIGNVAGGQIHIVVQVDGADRYSSGGTVVSAVPMNYEFRSDSASGTAYFASATGDLVLSAKTAPITVDHAVVEANLGDTFDVSYDDTIILRRGESRSVAVYTWAATQPPSWNIRAEWVEL